MLKPKINSTKQASKPLQIEILDRHITRNRHLLTDRIYAVTELVRVKKNVTITADDGVTILIQNGIKKKSRLRRAALIFNKGSQLKAKRIYLKSCDSHFKQTKIAANGGLWFIGNSENAEKDTIRTTVKRQTPRSSFSAEMIATYYLGCSDSGKKTVQTSDTKDDIDALSILGMCPVEWSVTQVRSFYSGDDGIDLTNSHVRLDRLWIYAPVEDGINLSSSHLEIRHSLNLNVEKSKNKDRDLVDFETDDGASFIQLHANCYLELDGVFGDEVTLASKEMPKPDTSPNNESSYQFKGRLRRSALIYSLDED